MNSIYLLIHSGNDGDGECWERIVSAHPTESVAKSAERFFRSYGDFNKHEYEYTEIREIPFEG